MTIWIEKAFAIAVHERQLAEHGGIVGVRDEGLLDSALARPQQLHPYGDPAPDIADLAASLAFGLASNHPLLDGNKLTAHVCYRVFLALNGADIAASDEEKYVAMLSLSEGSLSESEFAAWLREHIRLDTANHINESRPR
ncbi:MAG: Fic family protein [Xanthomonadales bacterium]|nr:Fic family protein [Xanthomonadales bacterium]